MMRAAPVRGMKECKRTNGNRREHESTQNWQSKTRPVYLLVVVTGGCTRLTRATLSTSPEVVISVQIASRMQAEDLQRMAAQAFPVIQAASDLHKAGDLTDYDFVGVYILALAASRRVSSWCTGRLKPWPARLSSELGESSALERVQGLVQLLGGMDFIVKKLGNRRCLNPITVQDIFNELHLAGIKHNKNGTSVNTSMVQWSLGKRPFVVMPSVPSPLEVLQQQAKGTRVVSVFLTQRELEVVQTSQLVYMLGAPNHSRDALEFTIHDLSHMEHFCDQDSHFEQRGFFKCMLRLGDGSPRDFFCFALGLDDVLWHQLEYVLSDMNCFVPHLLQYTLAKIVEAVNREERCGVERSEPLAKLDRLHRMWSSMLDAMGMSAQKGEVCPARLAADALFLVTMQQRSESPHLTRAEAEALRCWFQEQVNKET